MQRNGPRYGGVFGATLYAGGMILSSFASSTIYLLVSLGIVTGITRARKSCFGTVLSYCTFIVAH